jgi:hypothetical protein
MNQKIDIVGYGQLKASSAVMLRRSITRENLGMITMELVQQTV